MYQKYDEQLINLSASAKDAMQQSFKQYSKTIDNFSMRFQKYNDDYEDKIDQINSKSLIIVAYTQITSTEIEQVKKKIELAEIQRQNCNLLSQSQHQYSLKLQSQLNHLKSQIIKMEDRLKTQIHFLEMQKIDFQQNEDEKKRMPTEKNGTEFIVQNQNTLAIKIKSKKIQFIYQKQFSRWICKDSNAAIQKAVSQFNIHNKLDLLVATLRIIIN